VPEEDKYTRERLLHLLRTGLLTQQEAATLAGIKRQAVHQWVRSAGIDPTVTRKRHLTSLWRAYSVNSD
jgi:DNA-binding XRE family transcriptional regulator